MINKILTPCLLVFMTQIVNAQKINASEVPGKVLTAFKNSYPGTKVNWEKEKGQYEASFKKEGKSISALYKPDGILSETEMDIKPDQLPAPVIPYVKEHFKGAIITESSKITKADGTINYEAGIHHLDLLFDDTGKFIKAVKD